MPDYIEPVQRFDDGSSIQTFDDGSTLVTDSEGAVSSTPSPDEASSAAGGGSSLLSGASDAIGGAVSGAVSNALNGLVGGAIKGLSGALSGLLASSLKKPMPTGIIPNPMHSYASWSYALSLWWLDIDDYTRMTSGDAVSALSYGIGPMSYVIAEDSGLYPDRRLPTQLGLNYNIQDVNFETVVGLNSKSKSSNMTTGSMTIVEPYGVTFLDSLVKASGMGGTYRNYTSQPYMLQIDFTGYDDAGNPLPSSETDIYRKRFPIHIIGMTIEVTGKGSEYKLEYVPMGHIAHSPEHATVPKDLTVNADTVGGFFTAFENALNAFWKLEALSKKSEYGDSIKFKIDPAIAKCAIVYPKQQSITQANPNAKPDGAGKAPIDLSKGNFAISAGTQITEVINRVVQQSDFMTGQLGLDKQNDDPSNVKQSESQILNSFKTTVNVGFAGTSGAGAKAQGAFDNIRNTYPKEFTYNISQYHVYDAKHPAAPKMSDPRPYTVKEYSYIYTGQNIDVLDLKINFDTTFYTAVNAYTTSKAATNVTPSTALDNLLSIGAGLLISPQLLGSLGVLPGINGVANLTPNRYKNIVNDQRQTTGLNTINNPAAQVGASVQNSLYTNQKQEMISVDLNIVGDPTFLKQDDWLYNPDPSASGGGGLFGELLSKFDQAQKHGHIKMDDGELIVGLTINTPVDIDTEWTNKGLMYPEIGTTPSMFSGTYRVITIKNTFTGGKFTQQLGLVRQSNSDILRSGVGANSGARGLTDSIQLGLNSLNSSISGAISGAIDKGAQSLLGLAKSAMGSEATPASDSSGYQNEAQQNADGNGGHTQATFDSAGAVNSEYDASRSGEG
jgi:hypothetical protein